MANRVPRQAVRRAGLGLLATVALLAWYSCSADRITAHGSDTTTGAPSPAAGAVTSAAHSGILFGSMNLGNSLLSRVHTGAWRPVTPANILAELSGARARGGRLILRLVPGDRQLKNADGTFSFEKWKAMVDRYKSVDFRQYIDDGTLVGHYMIDEPHLTARWNGGIQQSTLEAMARHSKQLWPDLVAIVRVVPSWLAQAPVAYRYLDAAYIQYTSRRGDPAEFLAREVAAAQSRGLGVVLSMNVLDGGTSSSGIPGYSSGKFAMSAAELRRFGSVLLNERYGCAFIMYQYEPSYYNRSDIRSAMADLSRMATGHPSTSCRQ